MMMLPDLARRSRSLRVRRFSLPALVIVALFVQLGLSTAARAQGTMGALPDPITSRDLDDYARRMGLSSQQRASLEGFHEAYKLQFAALRDGEIEKYLSGNAAATGGQGGGRNGGGNGGRGGQGMGGRGMGMGMLLGNTDRKALEEAQHDLNSINDKIKTLDNSLFDSIQGMLTEDQVTLLSSVRQSRERERYRTGLSRMATFTNPSTNVDLTELVSNLTLSPDEKTNVQPLLTSYESSLTTAVRKLHDDANESTVTMLEKLEKLGFTADNVQDGRRRGEMFEAVRTVWGEVMTKMNERSCDISDLNRRTERSLTAAMTADNARRLRDGFYRRAYPEVRGSATTARAFETVLKFDDLTEEQRTAITAMQQQYVDGMDRVTEQMADIIDTQRKNRNPLEFMGDVGGGGGRGQGQRGGNNNTNNNGGSDDMEKLREQRQQLVDGMRTQLESTLGPVLTEKLQQRVAQSRDRQRGQGQGDFTATFVAVAPAGGNFVVPGAGVVAGGAPITINLNAADIEGLQIETARDPFVPQPITGRDLDEYAKRLGLDDDGRSILNGLHTEYTDRFKQIEDTEIQAVRDADENLWQRNDDGRPTPPTPEAVDHLYALRRQAIASIKTLDEQFFNDVSVAALTEDKQPLLDRVRQSRLRAVYNRGGNGQNVINFGGGRGRGPDGGGGGPGGGQRGGPGRMFFSGLGGGTSESSVDVSSVVEQSKMDAAVVKPLDPALAEYESAATAAFQIMFESTMRLRQAGDRMAGRFMRGGDNNGAVAINGDELRQTMENEGKAAREAAATLTTLNRETLDRLLAQLDGADATTLRTAYNRRAYPDIYRDWRSAEPRLEAALALPDLTDQQRDQVQNMTLEFRSGYETLCEQMVELERNAPPLNLGTGGNGPPDASALQAMQERLRNREKLEFERTDLSDKMLARLRATLTEEQVQRLGLDQTRGSS